MTVRAGKQRAVLAALLLNANRLVSLEDFTETLWGHQPPRSARVTVQNYVRRLRDGLGETGRARIRTQARGYLIRVDAGELDVTRFEARLRESQAAGVAGDWGSAAREAGAALALWRGEPLADVESPLLIEREIPRLAELRLQALEARIGAELRLGWQTGVIAELRQLIGAHPWRERLYGLLMTALYRDGNQAEALATYQRARQILIGELGTEPGLELQDLHLRILRADSAAAAPSPAIRGGPAVPRELPAAAAHFTGRTAELAALTGGLDGAAALGTVPIMVITGMAGVGKTALALSWAHQVADRFPDGQLYVNLRGFGPPTAPVRPEQALRGFLAALQVAPGDIPVAPEAQAGLYRTLLAGRKILVVLDNARDEQQVRPLLPAGPGCLVVVTGRGPLAGLVAAEAALPVTLGVLSQAEGEQMFIRRVGGPRAAAERAAVSELTRLCGRLPLALAITAARAAVHPSEPLAAIATELRGRGELTAALATDSEQRQRPALTGLFGSRLAGAAAVDALFPEDPEPGPDAGHPGSR